MARRRKVSTSCSIDFTSLSRPDTTHILAERVALYWIKRRFSSHMEVGLLKRGRLRADVLSLNTKGQIEIVEVKSCLADYRSDKKWEKYLKFCNKFYFCIPCVLYEKHGAKIWSEIKDSGAGLMVCSPLGNIRIKHRAKERSLHYRRKLRLLTKLAWRGGRFQ